MARQEDTCWRCSTEWASEPALRTTLRLIHGDAHAQIEDGEPWTNEGGSFRSDVTAPLPARAAGG
jgi:hypothetical protein